MTKKLIFLFLALISFNSYSQSNSEKAYENGMKAIKEMEAGNIKEAIKLLKQSEKLDPENINYPYEIAYANYLDKNYKGAIKILNSLKSHKQVNDRVYQMLGNCLDMDKQPKKAIETYEKGLKLFPKSGILYLERGNMELQNEKYNEALAYYEKGIEAQPTFPSNYYWSAKLFLNSTEEVWGMIYGEIFMNLERNTKRTVEMSKLLFDTYKSEIKFTSDSSMSVSFSKNATINVSDLSDAKNFKLPFGVGAYEPTLLMCVPLESKIDLSSLNRIRTSFVEKYYELKNNEKYPVVLFDYQKQLNENGHLEAYNHWILMMGDQEGFTKWEESNKDKWNDFVKWFSENPISINSDNLFLSGQF